MVIFLPYFLGLLDIFCLHNIKRKRIYKKKKRVEKGLLDIFCLVTGHILPTCQEKRKKKENKKKKLDKKKK